MRNSLPLIIVMLLTACDGRNKPDGMNHADSMVSPSSTPVAASVLNGPDASEKPKVPPHDLRTDSFQPKFSSADPAAPLEVAVIVNSGSTDAVPVLSIPPDLRQFGGATEGVIDGRFMGARESLAQVCPKFDDGGNCNISADLVAQHHFMSSIPDRWLNAKGKSYQIRNGVYSLVGGEYIGFELDNSRSSKELDGLVLLSRKDGFPPSRLLAPSEWQGWTEVKQELHMWATQSRDLMHCRKQDCKRSISWLSLPEHLQGQAREFRLPDGRALQFLQAISKTKEPGVLVEKPADAGEGSYPDVLEINLWRLVRGDGSVRLLKIDDRSREWKEGLGLWGAGLDSPYCENSCGAKWGGMPEVVNYHDRTFILVEYSSGTVSGILLFELLSGELKYRGRYLWGT